MRDEKGNGEKAGEENTGMNGASGGAGGNRGDRVMYKQFFENQMQREWLSTEEAAYFLSITPNALRIMVHRGQVQVYRFGRRLRFRVQDCRRLIATKGA
jgi:excisionase family DNA binding protein